MLGVIERLQRVFEWGAHCPPNANAIYNGPRFMRGDFGIFNFLNGKIMTLGIYWVFGKNELSGKLRGSRRQVRRVRGWDC